MKFVVPRLLEYFSGEKCLYENDVCLVKSKIHPDSVFLDPENQWLEDEKLLFGDDNIVLVSVVKSY